MASPIEQAIRQIVDEKGLSYESVLEAIESALGAAYRKDFGHRLQNIDAKFNPEDGGVELWDVKTVVEDQELAKSPEEWAQGQPEAKRPFGAPEPADEVLAVGTDGAATFNPKTEIMLSDARVLKMGAPVALGDVLRTTLPVPGAFGRMAAMTAKQVIMQKLREAEREVVYNTYKEQEGELIVVTVGRREGRAVLLELGRGVARLLPEDQIPGERYYPGDRLKVYLRSVAIGARGPEILASRTVPEFVSALFKVEIPEVADGTVKIQGVAREPGLRSKVAVSCDDDHVDPIGACIGQRGARIQTIIGELNGEKVDIIEWDAEAGVSIMNALAPAKVKGIELDEGKQRALVTVPPDQLSLAIGRGGQNVRLAARLTGWKIDIAEESGTIKGSSEGAIESSAPRAVMAKAEEAAIVQTVAAEEDKAEAVASLKEKITEEGGETDAGDPDDENDDDAEEAEAGLAAEELPSATAEKADDAT